MQENNYSNQLMTGYFDAAAVVKDLLSRPTGSVQWHSTKRCLIELVTAAADERVLTNGHGEPASRTFLSQRVFRAVGMAPPKPRHLHSVVYRIRNRVMQQPPLEVRVREGLM
jgi:hypothetical protein